VLGVVQSQDGHLTKEGRMLKKVLQADLEAFLL
jgi:hypothetical protein